MILRISAILFGVWLAAPVRAQTADEYRVKAAFLYNFAKFVEWPAQAFKGPADPISICIIGKNPFGNALEQAVIGQTVQGRAFTVRQVTEAPGCQVLFVSSSERKRLPDILRQAKPPGVLTVGECDNFTAEGGVMNFRIQDGTVKIQVNVDAAAQQQIRISSKLLGLAEIVKKP